MNTTWDQYKDAAEAAAARGDFATAESLWTQLLAAADRAGHHDARFALGLDSLGKVYAAQKRFPQAEAAYSKGIQVKEALFGGTSIEVAKTCNFLAALCYEQEKFEKTEALGTRALSIYQSLLGNDHPAVATMANNLARLRQKIARPSVEPGPPHAQVALTAATPVSEPIAQPQPVYAQQTQAPVAVAPPPAPPPPPPPQAQNAPMMQQAAPQTQTPQYMQQPQQAPANVYPNNQPTDPQVSQQLPSGNYALPNQQVAPQYPNNGQTQNPAYAQQQQISQQTKIVEQQMNSGQFSAAQQAQYQQPQPQPQAVQTQVVVQAQPVAPPIQQQPAPAAPVYSAPPQQYQQPVYQAPPQHIPMPPQQPAPVLPADAPAPPAPKPPTPSQARAIEERKAKQAEQVCEVCGRFYSGPGCMQCTQSLTPIDFGFDSLNPKRKDQR